MGHERKIKQAVYEIFKMRGEGDLLMDAPVVDSWRELQKYAADRDYWRTRTRELLQPRVRVELGPHFVEGACVPFTTST